MPHINIDLVDGKPPVSFSLKSEDADRFQAFMAKYATLQDVVDRLHEKMENLIAAGLIPMPDGTRLHALQQSIETIRDDLAEHIDYEPL